jgi:hypothetical protein
VTPLAPNALTSKKPLVTRNECRGCWAPGTRSSKDAPGEGDDDEDELGAGGEAGCGATPALDFKLVGGRPYLVHWSYERAFQSLPRPAAFRLGSPSRARDSRPGGRLTLARLQDSLPRLASEGSALSLLVIHMPVSEVGVGSWA